MIDTENEVEMDKSVCIYPAFTLHLPCIYLPLGLYQFIVMERIVIQDLLFDPPILTSSITKHGDILHFFLPTSGNICWNLTTWVDVGVSKNGDLKLAMDMKQKNLPGKRT